MKLPETAVVHDEPDRGILKKCTAPGESPVEAVLDRSSILLISTKKLESVLAAYKNTLFLFAQHGRKLIGERP